MQGVSPPTAQRFTRTAQRRRLGDSGTWAHGYEDGAELLPEASWAPQCRSGKLGEGLPSSCWDGVPAFPPGPLVGEGRGTSHEARRMSLKTGSGSLRSLFTLSGNWSSQRTRALPTSAAQSSWAATAPRGPGGVGLSQEAVGSVTASLLDGNTAVTRGQQVPLLSTATPAQGGYS